MPLIYAKDLVVDFPIYGSTTNRSFKKTIVHAATGGALAKDASEHVVVRALDHLNFEFHDGDRVGLIGHNGSGKSTLLRVLAGIYEPVSGELSVKGRVASMLSITLGMDMEATGLENTYMRGHVMGIPAKKMASLIDDIEEFSGIGDFLHLPIRTYSSGMTMRLAFAISTCFDSDIILMDEWLSVGDSEFATKAKTRLNRMLNNARIVVIASHNHSMVQDQCNKIIHLEHGKILSIELKGPIQDNQK
jgi:lipopolysaccharide transport system ATP-binding protein